MTIKNTFAHLMGLGAPSAVKKADGGDDDRKQREGESDEDYQKRMKEMDDADAARKAAETGDNDDKDKKGDDAKAAAFTERARCVSIMKAFQALVADPAISAKAEQARVLMCADLPADQAVAALKAGGAIAAASAQTAEEPKSQLDRRMQEAAAAAKANGVQASGGPAKPDMNTPAGRAAAILASGNGSHTIKSA